MVSDNKIGSLTRTWPALPVKKDNHDKNNPSSNKEDKKEEPKEKIDRDPGDTIIDEYV